jgi:hypothetical protein
MDIGALLTNRMFSDFILTQRGHGCNANEKISDKYRRDQKTTIVKENKPWYAHYRSYVLGGK